MTPARAVRGRSIRSAMARKPQYIQVSTTVAKRNDAERIAGELLRKKLCACAQIIGPITSVFRWKGKTVKATEWLCAVKTEKSQYKKVEKAIRDMHPYELPEIIATPIIAGSRDYFNWMQKECYGA